MGKLNQAVFREEKVGRCGGFLKLMFPGPAFFAVCKPFTINYTAHGQILNEKPGKEL